MNIFHKIAYILFGKYINAHQEEYNELRLAIKQARLGIPWDIYVVLHIFHPYLTAFLLMVAGISTLASCGVYLYYNI